MNRQLGAFSGLTRDRERRLLDQSSTFFLPFVSSSLFYYHVTRMHLRRTKDIFADQTIPGSFFLSFRSSSQRVQSRTPWDCIQHVSLTIFPWKTIAGNNFVFKDGLPEHDVSLVLTEVLTWPKTLVVLRSPSDDLGPETGQITSVKT